MYKFPRFYYEKKTRDMLEERGDKNPLTEKWILGKERNPYYSDTRGNEITKRHDEYYALVDWTLPSIKYNYKLLNKEEYEKSKNKKYFRSSFIPVVNMNGENYWFLGSFHDYEKTDMPILADFGGKCENRDRDFQDCALRELREESKHLMDKLVKDKLKDFYNLAVFEGTSDRNSVIFIAVPLEYEEIKNIRSRFSELPHGKEKLGAPNLYKQRDIQLRKYRTSKNLTDFVSFLNKYKF